MKNIIFLVSTAILISACGDDNKSLTENIEDMCHNEVNGCLDLSGDGSSIQDDVNDSIQECIEDNNKAVEDYKTCNDSEKVTELYSAYAACQADLKCTETLFDAMGDETRCTAEMNAIEEQLEDCN